MRSDDISERIESKFVIYPALAKSLFTLVKRNQFPHGLKWPFI